MNNKTVKTQIMDWLEENYRNKFVSWADIHAKILEIKGLPNIDKNRGYFNTQVFCNPSKDEPRYLVKITKGVYTITGKKPMNDENMKNANEFFEKDNDNHMNEDNAFSREEEEKMKYEEEEESYNDDENDGVNGVDDDGDGDTEDEDTEEYEENIKCNDACMSAYKAAMDAYKAAMDVYKSIIG